MKAYLITPVPKPRMTKRDCHRPSAKRYWAFKDQVKIFNVQLPYYGATVVFVLPMPKSWSKKKKSKMNGKPHQQTPDLDNLLKALGDAVYQEDKKIYDICVSKRWGFVGGIFIYELSETENEETIVTLTEIKEENS